MKQVGVAIITYYSAEAIGPCLDACASNGLTEIVVVDNASEDETCSEVLRRSGVRLIRNARNRGFAAAVNQAIAALETPFVLLMNPDTVLMGGVEALLAACSEAGVGAAGGMLVEADGTPQNGFMVRRFPAAATLCFEVLGWNRLLPSNPVNRRYRYRDLAAASTTDVEQPAGAFLMIRRTLWGALGGFDEEFFPLWFEDVDFCRRLTVAGYRIRFTPGARARHLGGHSARRMSWECQQVYWYGSLLKYASKHFHPSAKRMVCLAVMLGSVPRMLWGMILHRSLRPLAVFGKVIWIAGTCLVSGRIARVGVSQGVGTAVG